MFTQIQTWENLRPTKPKRLAETASGSKRAYTHTRSGCRTCKLRKIRCDEALPECHNCTKAGRACDRTSRLASVPALRFERPLTVGHFRPSGNLIGMSEKDVIYLELFRHRLIDTIVGSDGRIAWKNVILQCLHEEPVFRQIAIAFSAIYGLTDISKCISAVSNTLEASLPATDKVLALRHYNRSIIGLQNMMVKRDRSSVNTALLCILFCICFELRINSPHIALTHIEYGISFLQHILESSAQLVDDDILFAFAKVDIQASIFLQYRPPKIDPKSIIGVKGTITELDKDLTYLLSKILYFIRTKTYLYRYFRDGAVPSNLYTEARDLEAAVDCFQVKYLKAVPIPNLVDMVQLLSRQQQISWIKFLTMKVLIATCLSFDEMIYDGFLSHFTAIIALSESILCSAPTTRHQSHRDFTLDMSILFPLFLTALSCRSPLLRRRAIRLMATAPFDEGVWDGASGQKYTELVLHLEEEHLNLDAENVDEIGPSAIPEWSRIRALNIQPTTAKRYSTQFLRRSQKTGNWEDLVQLKTW